MVLSCSAFTLLALVMSLFPLAPQLPGGFPNQTTPEFLMLEEKYRFGVPLRIIKKQWRPHATQTSWGVGSWRAEATLALISSSLPMGRLPRLLASSCPAASAWGKRETKEQPNPCSSRDGSPSFSCENQFSLWLPFSSLPQNGTSPVFGPSNALENWGQKGSTGMTHGWLFGKMWELNLSQI